MSLMFHCMWDIMEYKQQKHISTGHQCKKTYMIMWKSVWYVKRSSMIEVKLPACFNLYPFQMHLGKVYPWILSLDHQSPRKVTREYGPLWTVLVNRHTLYLLRRLLRHTTWQLFHKSSSIMGYQQVLFQIEIPE